VPTPGATPGHAGITRNWVAAIRTGAALLAPGVEGIRSLELSNAMYLSAWLDQRVDLPIDASLFRRMLEERIRTSTFQKAGGDKTMEVRGTFGR
jgi:hypothetical protein